MKHTPGPWYPVEYAGIYRIQDEDGYTESDLQDAEKNPNVEADVKLMAAAPELLESLIAVMKEIGVDHDADPEGYSHIMQNALGAIKKATD